MLSPSLFFHYRNLNTTTTKSAPYISLTSFECLLPLTILQNNIEFTCSLIQPKYVCCQLNPGCRISYNQIVDMLCHKYNRSYLFLTSFIAFTRLHHWFIFIQLFVFPPTEIVVSVFLYRSPQYSFQILQHKVV
jgi:hypothetical protein